MAIVAALLLVAGIFGVTHLYETSLTYFVIASAVYLFGAVLAAFVIPLLFERRND